MTEHSDTSREETAIRALITARDKAISDKDSAGVIRHYTPDIRVFDLAPPLTAEDVLDSRGIEAWFATWIAPIGYETVDMRIASTGTLAFAHGFARISGRKTDGENVNVWIRQTLCLHRKDGNGWRIAHEHNSVPFYMDGSYRAATDLKP
ncbi:hypothetical protein ACFB49_04940 [Sphingomonas sp. DBB INV C78]|uniref:YybH family protein n=1 Tax=Sphingomonas sp. DBB INV C78 TaxID=3349434 RepID=UPI0036D37C8F